MNSKESDEQRKLTRRVFIQYSTVASGVAAGIYGITMKTDAAAQGQVQFGAGSNMGSTYPYT